MRKINFWPFNGSAQYLGEIALVVTVIWYTIGHGDEHPSSFIIFGRLHFRLITFTYLFTYWLAPWSKVLLEKITVSQLVKKCPAFYETGKFITAFTSARHLSLSWSRLIQSISPHSWCAASFYSLFLSTIWWMHNMWSVIDLPRRNQHRWSPVISSTYGNNLESRMVEKILYVFGKNNMPL